MWSMVLCSLLFSFAANATVTIKARIHGVDYGQGDEKPFLMLSSGHVVWMKDSFNKSIPGSFSNEVMKFTIDKDHSLVGIEKLQQTEESVTINKALNYQINDVYVPTIVKDLDEAKTYFQESRYIYKSSQCFNKAHVWSYEWFKKHGLLSNKTWVFFTRRYIRRVNHQWWFHVAPSVSVQEEDIVRERVMDKAFTYEPLKVKEWTDIFNSDKTPCPLVEKYSDYANYPETGNCFTMRSSMYYHQPFDLESTDTWNTIKDSWREDDLKQAFMETLNEEFKVEL